MNVVSNHGRLNHVSVQPHHNLLHQPPIHLATTPAIAQAQPDQEDDLSRTILQQDAIFWDAYHRCDVDTMSQFFWPDVECYHDKGGQAIITDSECCQRL